MTEIVKNPIVVMKRYELKYLMDAAQTAYLEQQLDHYMHVDRFGLTSIASLYYDTPDFRLIRASIERPPFKEKIRLRSYGLASETSPVFLELKRKAHGVVYKRRVETTIPRVKRFFAGECDICAEGQINREITYFRDYYQTLAPSCLIISDRIAYDEPGSDLRLTIDRAPRYRTNDLTLTKSMDGCLLLPPGSAILELKVQQAVPLWLSRILDTANIRKTSFSKYGAAYQQLLRDFKEKG